MKFSIKGNGHYPFYMFFLSIRVRMTLNIGENRKFFLNLKSKLGVYHVLLTKPKNLPKVTLTPVENQQRPGFENTDSKDEIFCLY